MTIKYDDEHLVKNEEIVFLDSGRNYLATINLGYSSDYEPISGNGWDEPREGGYFIVDAEVISIEALDEDNKEVTDPQILQLIQRKFEKDRLSMVADDIAQQLFEEANGKEPPDKNESYDY
jgi:hypothetical protein